MVSDAKLRIILTVTSGTAQILTAGRLAYRQRRRAFWLDDGFAACAMLFAFVHLVCFWIVTSTEGLGPLVESHANRLRAFWAESAAYIFVVWASRVGVIFSSIRLIPINHSFKKPTYGVGVFLVCMWFGFFAQSIYVCQRDKSWTQADNFRCPDQSLLISELTFELFSDLVLVAFPIVLLAFVKFTTIQYRLILVVLSGSLLIAACSIAHAIYLVLPSQSLRTLFSIVEATASLMIANLVVAVLFIRRQRLGTISQDNGDPDDVRPPSPPLSKVVTRDGVKPRIGLPKPASLTFGSSFFRGMAYWKDDGEGAFSTASSPTGEIVVLPSAKSDLSVSTVPSSPASSKRPKNHKADDSFHSYSILNLPAATLSPPDRSGILKANGEVPSLPSPVHAPPDRAEVSLPSPAYITPGERSSGLTSVDEDLTLRLRESPDPFRRHGEGAQVAPAPPPGKNVRFFSPLNTVHVSHRASEYSESVYSVESTSVPITDPRGASVTSTPSKRVSRDGQTGRSVAF